MKVFRHLAAGGSGRVFAAVATAILGITLLAGLSPKDFAFDNAVSRTADGPGLEFGKYGVATAAMGHRGGPPAIPVSDGLTVELSVELADPHPEAGGFMFLMHVYGGDASSQFVIGQWRSYLIVMNGDDYRHERGSPRLSVDLSNVLNGVTDIAVVSDTWGAKVYLNGVLAASQKGTHFTMPESGDPNGFTLALGNSVHCKNSWPGKLRGFALCSRALPESEVGRINSNRDRSRLEVLYTFDRPDGAKDLENDASGNERHLSVSSNTLFIRSGFLDEPILHWNSDDGTLKDVSLNLLGFVPLGFCLAWVIRKSRGYRWPGTCAMVLFSGFMLSLFLELIQAWMPSRSSSSRDLMLNSLGAGLGALALIFWLRLKRHWSRPAN